MFDEPPLTAVTTPPTVMVAIPVDEETQGLTDAGVALPVKDTLPPAQTGTFPVMVGSAFIVT
jgi:hypothetical protein